MKKWKVISLIILFLIVVSGIYYFFILEHISVKLNGLEVLRQEVNNEYIETGVIVKNNNKSVEKGLYEVSTNGEVDVSKLGTYEVSYKVRYNDKEYDLKRKVVIVDESAPIISVNYEKVTRDYCTKKDSTKLKYSAKDNYDGDVTDKIEVIEEDEKKILRVSDSSGNVSEKEIMIEYSKIPKNVFKLNGNSKVFVPLNGTYNESGTKYTDGCGKAIDEKVKISGTVDTTTKGTYTLTYEVGSEEKLTRIVNVYAPGDKISGKVIYLTFDDGPGYYTKGILNTLKKYGVKATFFVTHQFPSYEYLLKEEAKEGHTVAVHTYTHNYNVYSSLDAYLNDFNKMNEVIKKQTREYTNLFRFPGGSSNTISKSYKKGIVTEIAKRMKEDGYVYFDWNVSSGDASNANSSKIYRNVTNGVYNCSKCVVLMHDIKASTANALDDILKTLTERGYTFLPLDAGSYTAHHGISN